MTIYDKKFAKLTFNRENQRLTQTWIGFASSENFREAINESVKFSRKHPVKTIISNTQKQALVKKEDTDYAAEQMPELIKNGLQKMAFILSESAFTQMSVKRFGEKSSNDFIHYFQTEEEAHQWLDN
ncbi:MAG: hypothetical protein ACNS60_06995 [Candidatus Cyclobacteriaceae bacterium M2_1C_046]